jgi:hypothetical protein
MTRCRLPDTVYLYSIKIIMDPYFDPPPDYGVPPVPPPSLQELRKWWPQYCDDRNVRRLMLTLMRLYRFLEHEDVRVALIDRALRENPHTRDLRSRSGAFGKFEMRLQRERRRIDLTDKPKPETGANVKPDFTTHSSNTSQK